MEELLKETIQIAKRVIENKHHLERINTNPTMQDKVISFLNDTRLYFKILESMMSKSKQRSSASEELCSDWLRV
jgi:hypothetical protein